LVTLSNLGLRELAATGKADYIMLAVALARDPARLRVFRSTLHDWLQRSILMDAVRFSRQAEAAYRAAWCQWTASVPAVGV
jgi:predicted O-linked N-acetylglucosamine transferase (SPINDLY family)